MFKKIGILHLPPSRPPWMYSNIYIPSAFVVAPGIIRIIAGFWDEKGISRAGYLDVAADNPLELLGFGESPSLDLGPRGAFDDNGVSPLCLAEHGNVLRMYYAGWQLNDRVRYLLFTGLAESSDHGRSFTRAGKEPVLKPGPKESVIRAGSFVYRHAGAWKMLYAAGSAITEVGGKITPTYALKSLASADGIHWPDEGREVFAPDPTRGEFGFGRPFVMQDGDIWKMWYGLRHRDRGYQMGYAESQDGETWVRKDEAMKKFNGDGWPHDDRMRAFPYLLTANDVIWMFYDGNDYGKEGLCVAVLTR